MRHIVGLCFSLLLVSTISVGPSLAQDPGNCDMSKGGCRRAMKGTCTGNYRICVENCRMNRDRQTKCSGPLACDARLERCLKNGQWFHGDTETMQKVRQR
jgi:hypothetical protein